MRRLLVIALLVIAGIIYNAVHEDESEHPRPGYVDTGETVTADRCRELGGELVGDVCYTP